MTGRLLITDHRPLELVRPGIAAVDGEIVGVGDAAPLSGLGVKDLIGDAVALAIRDRFLGSVEAQVHLLTHVARAGPAHQRLDLARLFRLVVEHPFLGLGCTGLHRGLRGLVDACDHGLSLARARTTWSGQQDLNLRPGVPKTPALPGCAMPRRRAGPRYTVRFAPASRAGPPQRAYRPSPKIACPTRSPGAMPSFLAVPPSTSSTARTGPPEGTSVSESGTVFSAMRKMRPSPRMKIMSSGI